MGQITAYSIDLAYCEHFRCHAAGLYADHPLIARLKVTSMAIGTAAFAAVRTIGRVGNLVIKIAKIVFYCLACLFSENSNRLKDHAKLLFLNASALAYLPLQAAIHTTAIVMGLISPKTAYRMLEKATYPIATITSRENQIWRDYKTPGIYHRIVNQIRFSQIPYYFQAIPAIPLGRGKQFHLFGANPTVLSDNQKKQRPILLFHGNGHFTNQSTWLPFLHFHQEQKNRKAVFTLNMPAWPIENTKDEREKEHQIDLTYILPKIEEIRSLFKLKANEPLEIDLMGHSRGSQIIQRLAIDTFSQFQIYNLVTVGTPFWRSQLVNVKGDVYDITGDSDYIYPLKSRLLNQKNQTAILNAGHSDIMLREDSLKSMQVFLNKT